MNAQQKVELAIRAAQLAKAALDMMESSEAQIARLRFDAVIRQAREMDAFIKRQGA